MKSASDILQRYFDTHNVLEGDVHAEFFAKWREIAGPGLADHTQVVDIKNGSAIVYVDHSGWMQKLSLQKERIIRSLNAKYPQLKIRNLLMKCVEPDQMGKPSVDFQRKQLEENMKKQRDIGREAVVRENTESEKIKNPANVLDTIEKVEDPEFKSILERLARETNN